MSALSIPALLIFPLLFCFITLLIISRLNQNKINPLTKRTHRPPGHHLGKQLGKEQLDLFTPFVLIFATPIIGYAAYVSGSRSAFLMYSCALVAAITISCSVFDIVKRWKRIQKLRLGYECELAVGQELNQLMLQGFHVFHDIQFDKFNIDHVVVGRNGVFSIETKGRSKKRNSRGSGKEEYTLTYEDGVLKFPGWEEESPAKQAQSQAKHLGEWLTGAVGFNVVATPVLVLPGWYINFKGYSAVPALAIGSIPNFFKKFHGMSLSEQKFKQIVFQLDNKSKDIPAGKMSGLSDL